MTLNPAEGDPRRENSIDIELDGGTVYDILVGYRFYVTQRNLLRAGRDNLRGLSSELGIYFEPPLEDGQIPITYGTPNLPTLQRPPVLRDNTFPLAPVAVVFYRSWERIIFEDTNDSLLIPRKDELFALNRVPYAVVMQETEKFRTDSGMVLSSDGRELTEAKMNSIMEQLDIIKNGEKSSGAMEQVLAAEGVHIINFTLPHYIHNKELTVRPGRIEFVAGLNPAKVKFSTPEEI